ncbi:MAG: SMP-30/gluconolactonase/LRE family protein [Tepidisphaeraceae bacterium]
MTPQIPIEQFEVFATGLDHPECVAFDRDGFLWAGGEAGQVYRIDRAGKVETIATLGGFTGGIAFSPSDELFVCNPSVGIAHVRRDGTHRVFASQARHHKLLTPNFPVFDSAGNLYVTDSGNWRKHNGYLLRFDASGNGTVVAGPFGYANGLALSADERRLFMVESDGNRVLRFDTDDFQHEVHANDVGRMPDGLALDASGNLYVSCYASDDIHRVSPDGRKTLFAHDPFAILLSRPTNMAFDGEWMYVANLGRTTVTRAKVDVKGQPLVNRI